MRCKGLGLNRRGLESRVLNVELRFQGLGVGGLDLGVLNLERRSNGKTNSAVLAEARMGGMQDPE